MFLEKGATRYCMNPVAAKADPQALEDGRCKLIGNTFHAGVVAFLFAPLFVQRGLLTRAPTPYPKHPNRARASLSAVSVRRFQTGGRKPAAANHDRAHWM